MVSGSIPALITPFRNGIVDERAFQDFIEWQIAQGAGALVPAGTTGEAPTLSHDEHRRVVQLCVEAAARRVPVIAGAGSNSTAEAIALTRFAKEIGADAVLSAAGYYNRPSQEGLYQHFKAVAEAVDIPIYLYNIPGRSVVDISVETMGRLAKLKNIVGVKDAVGNVARVPQQAEACGAKFIQLSGEDGSALGFNAHGGVGAISVTANVAPKLCAEMQAACAANDFAKARALDAKLMALHRALFLEPSPGPVKYACSLLGRSTEDVRLPILPPTEPVKARIRDAMIIAGVLN